MKNNKKHFMNDTTKSIKFTFFPNVLHVSCNEMMRNCRKLERLVLKAQLLLGREHSLPL